MQKRYRLKIDYLDRNKKVSKLVCCYIVGLMVLASFPMVFATIGISNTPTKIAANSAISSSSNTLKKADSTNTISAASTGPTITSVSPSKAAVTDKTPSIQAYYSDSSGIDTDSVKITVDGVDVTSQATVTSSCVTYVPSTAMTYDAHEVAVQVSDKDGNTVVTQSTFTVETPVVEATINNVIQPEKTATIQVEEKTDIISVAITPKETPLSSARFYAEQVAEQPTEVPSPANQESTVVYNWYDMKLFTDENKYIEDGQASVVVTFKVEQTWIQSEGIDKNTICLMRYHNNEWEELSTALLREDTDYIYYAAETPGFSTFAIVGDKLVETTPPAALDWTIIIGVISAILIILVGILFKAKYIYSRDEQRTIQSMEKSLKNEDQDIYNITKK